YQAVPTLYALIMALCFVKGMNNFEELKKIINTEVGTIDAMVSMLAHLGETSASAEQQINDTKQNKEYALGMVTLLYTYVSNIGKKLDRRVKEESRLAIEKFREFIKRFRIADNEDRIVHPRLLKAIERLHRLRVQRLSAEGTALP